jgi:hypothetical protein
LNATEEIRLTLEAAARYLLSCTVNTALRFQPTIRLLSASVCTRCLSNDIIDASWKQEEDHAHSIWIIARSGSRLRFLFNFGRRSQAIRVSSRKAC